MLRAPRGKERHGKRRAQGREKEGRERKTIKPLSRAVEGEKRETQAQNLAPSFLSFPASPAPLTLRPPKDTVLRAFS